MLAVLIVGGLVLGSADVDAKKKRHRQKADTPTIVVEDYTSMGWDTHVAETTEDFAAVLAGRARVSYARKTPVACADIPRRTSEARRVAVCTAPHLSWHGMEVPGETAGNIRDGARRTAVVRLSEAEEFTWFRDGNACHEFMHAFTGIADNYGAHTESCVWGFLSDPGAFDVAHLVGAFGRTHR